MLKVTSFCPLQRGNNTQHIYIYISCPRRSGCHTSSSLASGRQAAAQTAVHFARRAGYSHLHRHIHIISIPNRLPRVLGGVAPSRAPFLRTDTTSTHMTPARQSPVAEQRHFTFTPRGTGGRRRQAARCGSRQQVTDPGQGQGKAVVRRYPDNGHDIIFKVQAGAPSSARRAEGRSPPLVRAGAGGTASARATPLAGAGIWFPSAAQATGFFAYASNDHHGRKAIQKSVRRARARVVFATTTTVEFIVRARRRIAGLMTHLLRHTPHIGAAARLFLRQAAGFGHAPRRGSRYDQQLARLPSAAAAAYKVQVGRQVAARAFFNVGSNNTYYYYIVEINKCHHLFRDWKRSPSSSLL